MRSSNTESPSLKLLLLCGVLMTGCIKAQSNAVQLCDQQSPRHCITIKAPASLAADLTCPLTGNFGPCAVGTGFAVTDQTAVASGGTPTNMNLNGFQVFHNSIGHTTGLWATRTSSTFSDMEIHANSFQLYGDATGAYNQDGSIYMLAGTIGVNGVMQPAFSDNTIDIGTGSKGWKDAWLRNLKSTTSVINTHSLLSLTHNTYDVGSQTAAYRYGFFQSALGTEKLQIHNDLGSNLSGLFFYATARVNSTDKYLGIYDTSSNPIVQFMRQVSSSGVNRSAFDTDVDPLTNNTRDLGASQRWRNLYLGTGLYMAGTQIIDVSGNGFYTGMNVSTGLNVNYVTGTQCLQAISGAVSGIGSVCGDMTLGTNQTVTGIKNFNNHITIGTNNTYDFGTTTSASRNGFFQSALGTEKLQIHNDLGSDLSGAFFFASARVSATDKYLSIYDSSSNPVVQFIRQISSSSVNRSTFDTDIDPLSNNARDLGASQRWRNLYLGTGLYMAGNQILDVSGNAFLNAATIAAGFNLNYIAGTQCLQVVSGAVSGTGAACGAGGGVTSMAATSPITVSASTGAVTVGCANCDTVNTNQTITGIKTWQASQAFAANATYDLGTGGTAGANAYFRNSMNSRKFGVFDGAASDLTGSRWTIQGNANGTTNDIEFLDTSSAVMFGLYRTSGGVGVNNAVLDANLIPSSANTYTLGTSSDRWNFVYGNAVNANALYLVGQVSQYNNQVTYGQGVAPILYEALITNQSGAHSTTQVAFSGGNPGAGWYRVNASVRPIYTGTLGSGTVALTLAHSVGGSQQNTSLFTVSGPSTCIQSVDFAPVIFYTDGSSSGLGYSGIGWSTTSSLSGCNYDIFVSVEQLH